MARGRSREAGDAAGIIARIRVENFMCHSNLSIDFVDNVNFITGQNGSGKSAILTALCIAFGIRARGTQRATSLKDFIKTGCSYALVIVEMKNEGCDSYKPERYGKMIIIERRITATASTTALKDEHGRKVSAKKEDLHDIIDHFNIDVENPCVIMSQDKSREFLHSGNDKEKFKFFYKATLLQHVSELLDANIGNIESCKVYLKANEETFRPYEQKLNKLDLEIRRAEKVDEMAQEVTNLRKKLAWSQVYDIDRKIEKAAGCAEKLRERIPVCQERIDAHKAILGEKRDAHSRKNTSISDLISRNDRAKEAEKKLYQDLTEVTQEKVQLEETLRSKVATLERKRGKKRSLEMHVREMKEKFEENTQVEENERVEALRALENEIDLQKGERRRMQEEEEAALRNLNSATDSISERNKEIEDRRGKVSDLNGYIRRLQNQQRNRLHAFGGEDVIKLLRSIENHENSFTRPPIGPIGAHVALAGDDTWALAVEVAVGRLLNAFVVTNHQDMLALRRLARNCNYTNLPIIIYNFEHPLLNLPPRMLPNPDLITVMSVLQSENHIVKNVLVDHGSVERQVLVENYQEGVRVVFNTRAPNVKEAFTRSGEKMFMRAGGQTTLPKDRNIRGGRLEAGIEQRITEAESDLSRVVEELRLLESQKRSAEASLQDLRRHLEKSRRANAEISQSISRKELRLRDLKFQAEQAASATMPNTEELETEILDTEAEARKLERVIEDLRSKVVDVNAKQQDAKSKHDSFLDSTKDDAEALRKAADELQALQEEADEAANAVAHFTKIMKDRVLPELQIAEEELKRLQSEREENAQKASQICPGEEVERLGGVSDSTVKLNASLERLMDQVSREERHITPVDELQRKKSKLEKKVFKKKHLHVDLKQRIEAIDNVYASRRSKFEHNTAYLSRQLRWRFNDHLKRKGFSGRVKIDYEAKTLKLEVQMPQDASNSAVKDTRALSGGERSFSTLCFALALHEMTESPFRAMDEFDVFMDAISRRISLETVVDFAIQEGSQWIFITPNDISSVKDHPKIKKQQMSAPRL
ncbi:structural maintenance of chromosomes protein 6A isoform X1 [Selaginella moellendorffii]|uniref:structural maintenance of chromosomes protein 6A isoform X1 n=2 Tax=Selaginella moellendorffii TaxID=88036 RepID=UPI000D1C283A|nr:structural maintenance of chromosomes protein 6A isoform X1 [Selaginella moellendorffii]|eukprot:XP_024531851.1 structural maintenance of chromosomes protein 6A isoform X1 [Selaginella moellendorffii]